MNKRTTQKRITVILGIFLAFIMGASLLLPLLSQSAPPPETAETATPAPTAPPPIADLSSITFDASYLHPTGIFNTAIPSGWSLGQTNSTENEALVIFNNAEQQSVVEVRVFQPEAAVSSAEDLNGVFNTGWLSQSWRDYTGWNEATRRVEGERLLIDFSVRRDAQNLIARQSAYTDGEWVYSVRVVTPDNASDMLRYILDQQIETIRPNKQFAGTPFNLMGYVDEADQHFIRYPSTWQITDAANGMPASIVGDIGALRVESADGSVDSEDAASEWITNWRSGITVDAVIAVEQGGAQGYKVAYSRTTVDGDQESGLAVLLNDEGRVHIANLIINAGGVDLMDAAEDSPYSDGLRALDDFMLLSALESNS